MSSSYAVVNPATEQEVGRAPEGALPYSYGARILIGHLYHQAVPGEWQAGTVVAQAIAAIPGIEDRDAADALRGAELYVPRSALPPPKDGEFYWIDLEGMRVANLDLADSALHAPAAGLEPE